MDNIKHLLLVGCGTSMNASLYGAKLMRDLGAFDTAQVMDASEVDAPDLPVKNGGVLAVSQSGETKDVLRSVTQRPFPNVSELQYHEDGVSTISRRRDAVSMIIRASTRLTRRRRSRRCVQKAMGHDVTALSVVNSVGSIIARTTKLGVYLNAGRENAVASTKAFTTQVTVRISASRHVHETRVHLTMAWVVSFWILSALSHTGHGVISVLVPRPAQSKPLAQIRPADGFSPQTAHFLRHGFTPPGAVSKVGS